MHVTNRQIEFRLAQLLQGQKRLLRPGEDNHKLAKNSVRSWILNLAPHKQNNQGKNLCAHASPGCQAGCLFHAGRGAMPNVELSRRLNSEIFLQHQNLFLQRLNQELLGLNMEAGLQGEKWVVRLNGTSDLDFPAMIKDQVGYDPIGMYVNLQFMDYTKNFSRWIKYQDTPYHLTFSRSETNWEYCKQVLERGGTVAVVFHPEKPSLYKGHPVFNGDINDERYNDPAGHVIGLSYKHVKGVDPATNPFIVKV